MNRKASPFDQIRFALILFLLFCGGAVRSAQASGAISSRPSEVYATASDGTVLHWDVYSPAGTGPWPAVLVIHGGAFRGGSTKSPDLVACASDLAAAGFIAFAIEYRMAPSGFLPGQVSDGRFPDQTDDVRLAVLAARADTRCNRRVGIVGGSAGGYFAAFMAGTGTVGQDRIDVGVSLSGPYDLSDFSPDPGIEDFIKNATNYVGVSGEETDALRAASPAYLADSLTAPLYLVRTEQDPMPFSQVADMTTRLDAVGVSNYETKTLPGANHSFTNWVPVKDRAIVFLTSWFTGIAPPPLPSPSPSPTPPPPSPSPSPSPTPPVPVTTPSPTKMLLNVSTRAHVESGTGVTIGGFIITGNVAKKVALRAIGPSLAGAGLTDVLSDPVLDLYDSAGNLVGQNDDSSTLEPGEIPAGLKPTDGHEALIAATLLPGSYTGILRGANGSSGVGLFELYDLDPASSRISNISTRGAVGAESDVMIGGFIVGGNDPTRVVVRAIGPSLTASSIPNALPNPLLELYDGNGSLIFSNDDWRTTQQEQILASGVPPSNDFESALVATLVPGGYTAVIRDAGQSTGIALVEVYNLEK